MLSQRMPKLLPGIFILLQFFRGPFYGLFLHNYFTSTAVGEEKPVPQPHTMYNGRYGNSTERGSGGPAFWYENVTAEVRKIVKKINNWPGTLFFVL